VVCDYPSRVRLLRVGVFVLEGDYGAFYCRAFRDSTFTVSNNVTTTGFVAADFDQWDTGAKTALVLLMFVGGCAGFTAGG
jgi:Trk-type K+ transport system membrane component